MKRIDQVLCWLGLCRDRGHSATSKPVLDRLERNVELAGRIERDAREIRESMPPIGRHFFPSKSVRRTTRG